MASCSRFLRHDIPTPRASQLPAGAAACCTGPAADTAVRARLVFPASSTRAGVPIASYIVCVEWSFRLSFVEMQRYSAWCTTAAVFTSTRCPQCNLSLCRHLFLAFFFPRRSSWGTRLLSPTPRISIQRGVYDGSTLASTYSSAGRSHSIPTLLHTNQHVCERRGVYYGFGTYC